MRAHFLEGVARLHHPTPVGFLGATSGITPDGRWVNVIRFQSEQTAHQNSARPEVGQWWEEGERYRKGHASFLDSTDTATFLAGVSDRSRFVQVLQATVSDRARFEALLARL